MGQNDDWEELTVLLVAKLPEDYVDITVDMTVSDDRRTVDMAAMALPIRELSACVQYEAAYAQKTFWEVAEGKMRAANFDVMLWVKTRQLSNAMGKLADLQRTLIGHLRTMDCTQYDADTFDRIACDLERIVSMTNSLVDDAYRMPQQCVSVWTPKLETLSDLTAHIDNFAESFRVASDEACTALLADIADKITADATTQALLGIR